MINTRKFPSDLGASPVDVFVFGGIETTVQRRRSVKRSNTTEDMKRPGFSGGSYL